MIFPDAKEGDKTQRAQPDQPGTQEDQPEVAVAEVHATEGAVGGEEDYLLDDDPEDDEEEDNEEDEEDEEEEMEKLLEEEEKKKDPDFDQMIDEQVRAGNIWLKVRRSIKRVMRRFQAGKKTQSPFFCRHCLKLRKAWLPIEGGGLL